MEEIYENVIPQKKIVNKTGNQYLDEIEEIVSDKKFPD